MSTIPTHKHGMKAHPVTVKHRGMTTQQKRDHKTHARTVVQRELQRRLS